MQVKLPKFLNFIIMDNNEIDDIKQSVTCTIKERVPRVFN
jgi:hypothetical protein